MTMLRSSIKSEEASKESSDCLRKLLEKLELEENAEIKTMLQDVFISNQGSALKRELLKRSVELDTGKQNLGILINPQSDVQEDCTADGTVQGSNDGTCIISIDKSSDDDIDISDISSVSSEESSLSSKKPLPRRSRSNEGFRNRTGRFDGKTRRDRQSRSVTPNPPLNRRSRSREGRLVDRSRNDEKEGKKETDIAQKKRESEAKLAALRNARVALSRKSSQQSEGQGRRHHLRRGHSSENLRKPQRGNLRRTSSGEKLQRASAGERVTTMRLSNASTQAGRRRHSGDRVPTRNTSLGTASMHSARSERSNRRQGKFSPVRRTFEENRTPRTLDYAGQISACENKRAVTFNEDEDEQKDCEKRTSTQSEEQSGSDQEQKPPAKYEHKTAPGFEDMIQDLRVSTHEAKHQRDSPVEKDDESPKKGDRGIFKHLFSRKKKDRKYQSHNRDSDTDSDEEDSFCCD